MSTNTEQNIHQKGFDKGYKWLHWSMAALILLMFFALIGFAEGITTQERMEMLVGHSSLGTIISVLLIIRVFKRFIKKDAQPVQMINKWQLLVSKAVQLGLYACMIIVPVSGYLSARFHELPVMVFGSFNINQGSQVAYNMETFLSFRNIHEGAISVLMALLVLHIGAAFYHKLVKKDSVLASMTRFKKA